MTRLSSRLPKHWAKQATSPNPSHLAPLQPLVDAFPPLLQAALSQTLSPLPYPIWNLLLTQSQIFTQKKFKN